MLLLFKLAFFLSSIFIVSEAGIISTNLRILNSFYENPSVNSQKACFDRCQNDTKCSVATYGSGQCYIFDKYEQRPEYGWNSYFRNNTPSIQLLEAEPFSVLTTSPVGNLTLIESYKKVIVDTNFTCLKTCYVDPRCLGASFEQKTRTCSLSDTNYNQVSKVGFTSYFCRFRGYDGQIISGFDAQVQNHRIANHYLQISGISKDNCFSICRKNQTCFASTFDLNGNNCYFFTSNSRYSTEKGWISYYPSVPRDRYLLEENTITGSNLEIQSTKLLNHSKIIEGLTKENCFSQCRNDSECNGSSYEINSQKCYFYKDFEQTPEIGWISFIRTKNQSKTFGAYSVKRNDPIGIDSSFYDSYMINYMYTKDYCFSQCKKDPQCVGASYDYPSKTCNFANYRTYQQQTFSIAFVRSDKLV